MSEIYNHPKRHGTRLLWKVCCLVFSHVSTNGICWSSRKPVSGGLAAKYAKSCFSVLVLAVHEPGNMAPESRSWLCHRICSSSSGTHALFQITSMCCQAVRDLCARQLGSIHYDFLGSFSSGYDWPCSPAPPLTSSTHPSPSNPISFAAFNMCSSSRNVDIPHPTTNKYHCRPKVGLQEEWSGTECIPSWNLGTNISCRFSKGGILRLLCGHPLVDGQQDILVILFMSCAKWPPSRCSHAIPCPLVDHLQRVPKWTHLNSGEDRLNTTPEVFNFDISG